MLGHSSCVLLYVYERFDGGQFFTEDLQGIIFLYFMVTST